MTDINAAIKAANEQASQIIDADVVETTLPARQGGVVVPMTKPSMASIQTTGGIANKVDDWLKVSEHGMKIGKDKQPFPCGDSLTFEVDMTEDAGFFVKQSIKWGKAPVQYASTYDGVMSDKNMPWDQQVAKVHSIDPAAKVFPSADIVFITTEPVKLKEKTIPAGTKLGHTLSMSNWRNWEEFYSECAQAGLAGQTVKVKVSGEEVNGSNTFTWGVLAFELAA